MGKVRSKRRMGRRNGFFINRFLNEDDVEVVLTRLLRSLVTAMVFGFTAGRKVEENVVVAIGFVGGEMRFKRRPFRERPPIADSR